MKKLLPLLFALPMLAMGQTNKTHTKEELRLVEKIYYERGEYIASDEERDKLKDLVFEMRVDSTVKVHIIGYGDKWGGKDVNDRFSYVRAMHIADWMCSCSVPRKQVVFVGEGIDSLAINDAEARRVEILQVVKLDIEPKDTDIKSEEQPQATAEPIEAVNTETQIEPKTAPKTKTESSTPAVAGSEPKQSFECNHFNLRTNLLYWLGGMMNIGAEYKKTDSNFGFVLNGGYSPFGNTEWNHNLGGWFVAPEVRYYLPSNEQWFMGAQFLVGGYNYKLSYTGRQGSVIGGGIMGGYKLSLSDNFDMDFTLGVGYGHLEYDTYYHDEATNTNPYIEKGVSKNSIMPIQVGVNLIWKIK